MEVIILTDRGICCVGEGGLQWLSLEEFAGSDLSSTKELAVLLGGIEYRQVKFSAAADKGISAELPGGFIMRQERLKGGVGLVMGAREEMLRGFYDIVPKGSIKVCVPYGLAVRAYLLSTGFVLEGAAHIVVNDVGARVFVTVIDGLSIVETRELVFQDGERIAEEVRRSEKRLLERLRSCGAVKVVSDHGAFLEAFIKQRGHEDIVAVDSVLSVFEVLERARFSVHFPSPEEEARKQKQEEWRRGALKYSLPLLVTAGAVLFSVIMLTLREDALSRMKGMESMVVSREAILKERSLLTYQEYLRSLKVISWQGSFLSLLDSLPNGWLLQNIIWESGLEGGEKVSVFILKGEEGFFDARGIYTKAVVVDELAGGQPALRVIYQKSRLDRGLKGFGENI